MTQAEKIIEIKSKLKDILKDLDQYFIDSCDRENPSHKYITERAKLAKIEIAIEKVIDSE